MSTRNHAYAALLSLSVALSAGPATADMVSLEQAIETSTATATLPKRVGDSVVTTPCVGCAPVMLRVVDATRFFLGRQQVSLAEFNKFVESAGPRSMGVFYKDKDRTVTRLVVKQTARTAR